MQTCEELYPQSEEVEQEDQPSARRCRHIFTAGSRCGSPCLRSEQFCYYHHTTRRPMSSPRERRNRTDVFDLPNPEDRDGVRAAVTQIMHAIAHNNIDMKRAGMILYSLQIALCSLPPQPPPVALRTPDSRRANSPVEDVVYEEPHGFIALEEEYEEPEEFKPRRSFARQLLDEVERYEARQALEAQQAAQQTEEDSRKAAGQLTEAAAPAPPTYERPEAIDLRAAADSVPAANPNALCRRRRHPKPRTSRPCRSSREILHSQHGTPPTPRLRDSEKFMVYTQTSHESSPDKPVRANRTEELSAG